MDSTADTGNFIWAQELAKQGLMAVDRKEITVDMPSLPGEVWAVVSEMLADEGDLSAINHLNASSSNIHDATLPILYETVRFKNIKELEHAVVSGDTDRWRYVHLATLLNVCNGWTSANATDIVGLFGHDSYSEAKPPGLPHLHRPISGNITDLLISSRAYVARPKATRDTTHVRRAQNLSRCEGKVFIADEVDLRGMKETLAMMFDEYPGRAGEPIGGDVLDQQRSKISLECSSSVLDLVTEAIRNCRAAPFFDCRIRLSGLATRKDMESHLVSLSEAYARHWIHRVLRVNEMSRFFVLESAAPPEEFTSDHFTAFAVDLLVDRTVWYPPREVVSTGPDHVYGFDAILWQADDMGNLRQTMDHVWSREYPVDSTSFSARTQDMGLEDDVSRLSLDSPVRS